MQALELRLAPFLKGKVAEEPQPGAKDRLEFPRADVMGHSDVARATPCQIISEFPDDWQGNYLKIAIDVV
jgi:hypothetical protein